MLTIGANTLEQAAVFSVTPSSTNAENADYDAGAFPKTITFAAGSGNGTGLTLNTTLDPADDTLVEGDETVTLTLAVTSGAATLGGQATQAVTILDADSATVSFQLATTTIGEAGGATNIAAVLTIGTNTLEQAAVFSVTPSSTNAENADYDAGVFPKTITFAAGSGNGTGLTLNTTLDPADDTLVEGDETVTLTLAATSGAATLGGQPANAVTILDADSATVSFQLATTTVGEAGGATNIAAVLTIGTNTLEQAAVFSVTPSSTNAENADYDAGGLPQDDHVCGGSGNGTGVTVNTTLDPADDTLVEGDETVTLTLAATSGAATLEASRRMRSRSWMRIVPRCRSNWRQRQSGKQTGRPTSRPC